MTRINSTVKNTALGLVVGYIGLTAVSLAYSEITFRRYLRGQSYFGFVRDVLSTPTD